MLYRVIANRNKSPIKPLAKSRRRMKSPMKCLQKKNLVTLTISSRTELSHSAFGFQKLHCGRGGCIALPQLKNGEFFSCLPTVVLNLKYYHLLSQRVKSLNGKSPTQVTTTVEKVKQRHICFFFIEETSKFFKGSTL